MNNESNLKSYDGVESVQLNEFSAQERFAYFKEKIRTAKADVDFVKHHVWKGQRLVVCEIGSGNSNLLYALEQENMLRSGIGYEVSRSRWELANEFGKLSGSVCVKNVNANFLDEEAEKESYDLILLVDIVFQLISPLYDAAQDDALKWIFHSLKRGGAVVFDFVDDSRLMELVKENGGVLRRWDEYDDSDPFQYGLHQISIDEDGNQVVEKTFIRRTSIEREKFVNVIKNYSREGIAEILSAVGFEVEIHPFYENMDEEQQSIQRGLNKVDRFRVIARK